jgi:hypothetical protein
VVSDTYTYDWDDKEWEAFCLSLVQERHGPTKVKQVPDQHKGDLGIEFFTVDGCVYQCYAPKFPASIKDRANRIKAKIRLDLNKFAKHKDELSLLFVHNEVKRWILQVPLQDSKEVVLALGALARKIRGVGLPYVSADFEVLAQDQTDFGPERESLRRRAALRAPITITPSADDDVPVWEDDNIELGETLNSKLRRGFPEDDVSRRASLFVLFVKQYVDAENLKHTIRKEFPDLWEGLEANIRSAEKNLILLGVESRHPRAILQAELNDITQRISCQLPTFQISDVEILTRGALADWLMRCPLDFPDRVS